MTHILLVYILICMLSWSISISLFLLLLLIRGFSLKSLFSFLTHHALKTPNTPEILTFFFNIFNFFRIILNLKMIPFDFVLKIKFELDFILKTILQQSRYFFKFFLEKKHESGPRIIREPFIFGILFLFSGLDFLATEIPENKQPLIFYSIYPCFCAFL